MSAVELGRIHNEIDLSSASILDLPELVEQYLTPDLKRVFYSIYDLSNDHTPLSYDSRQAEEYVQQRFKSPLPIKERSSQEVIDRVLGLATLFSPIRSKRPIQQVSTNLTEADQNPQHECDFCNLLDKTPKDVFGRKGNDHWATAANAGGYVAWHSIAVSKETHRPTLSEYSIVSLFGLAIDWFQTVHENDPEACCPFLGWNKGPRAGESIPHDHVQLLMRKKPSAKLGLMRERMADHRWLAKESYFRNLIRCLEPLGLIMRVNSATIIFHLTPIQEKEVIIYQEDPRGLPHYDLAIATYKMLRWWESIGVTDYNLALYMPPLGANLREGDWCDFYPHVRMTDRVSNMAVMELYDTPVVSGNPFFLAKSFKEFYSTPR